MTAAGRPAMPRRARRSTSASSAAKASCLSRPRFARSPSSRPRRSIGIPTRPLLAASGVKSDFVEGSQRGWAVTTKLKNEQPDIYKFLAGAVERASKNPQAIEALQKQELATTWFGPEASDKAYRDNAAKMAKYVDLLK